MLLAKGKEMIKINDFYIAPKIEFYKSYTWMYNRWQKLLDFTGRYNGVDIPTGLKWGANYEGFLLGVDLFNENIKTKFIFEKYRKGQVGIHTCYGDNEKKVQYEKWPGPSFEPIYDLISFSLFFELL